MKFAGIMPRRLFHILAPVIGCIGYYTPGFGSLCRMNVRAAFPEKSDAEVSRIARQSLANLFLSICEFFWVKGKKGVVEEIVHCDEPCCAVAEEARKHEDKGIIFITPHLGNWEFAGMTLALFFKFKVGTVVRTARNPYLDRLISSGRMVEGVRIIHSKGAVKGMLNALNEGYVIGTLIDQNSRVRDGGIFVNLFGLPVPVSRAPAMLARKSGRFIAVGTTLRDGMKFKGILRTLPKPSSEYETDEDLIQAITDIIEELIRLAPEQYLWMYKRFQYIPPGTPEEIVKRFPPYARIADERFYSKPAARKNPRG